MTKMTPIERARGSARNAYRHTVCTNDNQVMWSAVAHAVFDSIDTNQLARVIHAWDVKDGPCEGPFDDLTDTQKDVWRSAALAVKNWLTGKDQQ